MRKKQIEIMLKKEIDKITIVPSNLILNEKICVDNTVKLSSQKTWKNDNLFFKVFLPILTGGLCFCAIFCFTLYGVWNNVKNSINSQYTSYILKINPTFCITADSKDYVVGLCSLNSDADIILGNSAFSSIENMDLQSCINCLLTTSQTCGFFSNYSDTINLYAVNDDTIILNKKLEQCGKYLKNGLENYGLSWVRFEKNKMTLSEFKDRMGFENSMPKLDMMYEQIMSHNKFYAVNKSDEFPFRQRRFLNPNKPIY